MRHGPVCAQPTEVGTAVIPSWWAWKLRLREVESLTERWHQEEAEQGFNVRYLTLKAKFLPRQRLSHGRITVESNWWVEEAAAEGSCQV